MSETSIMQPFIVNFIFCKKDGVPGEETYRKIKEEGILVRHFNTPGIEEFLRITIGTHEQMTELKRVMENIQLLFKED